jgi:hypothetical protein
MSGTTVARSCPRADNAGLGISNPRIERTIERRKLINCRLLKGFVVSKSLSRVECSPRINPLGVAREGRRVCAIGHLRDGEVEGEFLAEQAVVLVLDHLVALADCRFEAAPVEYPYAAAHVADEPLLL